MSSQPVTFSLGDESVEDLQAPTQYIEPPQLARFISRTQSTPEIYHDLEKNHHHDRVVIDMDSPKEYVKNPPPRRSILSNLLQLNKKERIPKKPFAINLSSQSLQMFFGFPSRRSSDDGLTFTNERRIAAAIAAMLKRQKFIKDLCIGLISYGAPSHRLESNMITISKILNVDASFAALPGLMLISFGDSETHTSETVLLKVGSGYDMYKLDAVVQIYQRMVKQDLELTQADEELQLILKAPPLYPPWVELLSFGVAAFGSAPLFFNGGWIDASVAGLLGLFVGFMNLLSRSFSAYSHLFELIAAVSCAFIATALQHHVCYWSVVLAGTINLLPGLSLTTAVMDLASKNMISGSVRMIYSLVTAFILGFGLSLGVKLYTIIEPIAHNPQLCQPLALPFKLLLFFPTSISFNIFLLAHPRQWPSMLLIALFAFLASNFLPNVIHYPDVIPALSAFIIGVSSNLYARLTHTLPIVPLLGSILLLVPGSLSVKGSSAIINAQASEGSTLAVKMIVTALSITVGLFASTIMIFPMGRKRSAFMTF